MRDLLPILAVVMLLVPGSSATDQAALLVACAPGYPGSTEQARPTMDAFAAALALRAGWEAGALDAVYHEKEDAGLAALAEPRAALALVPLPFFLKHRAALELDPLLEVVPVSLPGSSLSGPSPDSWPLVESRMRPGRPGCSPGARPWFSERRRPSRPHGNARSKPR